MTDFFPLVRPLLHRLPAETAHRLTLHALGAGLVPSSNSTMPANLRTTLFGKPLASPIGLAAGFDKSAVAAKHLHALGFAFVEIGGVTPRAQAGNPRPRLFRLAPDRAVINRMGFNNDGAERVAARLAGRDPRQMLGVNLASNSDSADPEGDFATLLRSFARYADYLTLDISCPNTANGQLFLEPGPLNALLDRLDATFAAEPSLPRIPLLAKIGPDLDDAALDRVLRILFERAGPGGLIAGMVVSNTTRARPESLIDPQRAERGGLSGPPLFAASTALLGTIRRQAPPGFVLIGVGGISSGSDAFAKLAAGADAIQLYTALVFEGPAVVTRIARELSAILDARGFSSVAAAVGSAVGKTW